jgi:hypothetical protein
LYYNYSFNERVNERPRQIEKQRRCRKKIEKIYLKTEQAVWWFAPPPSNYSSSSSWYVTLPVTNNTARMMTVYPAVPPPEVSAAVKEVEVKSAFKEVTSANHKYAEEKADHKYAEQPLDRAADEGDFFANNIPWPQPPPPAKKPPPKKYWRGRPPHPNRINQGGGKKGERPPRPPPPPKRFYSDEGLYQNVDPEFYSPPAGVSIEDEGHIDTLPLYYYQQSEPVLEEEEAFPAEPLLTNELEELPLLETPQIALSGAPQPLASHSGSAGVDRIVYRPRVILCVCVNCRKNVRFLHLHLI